MLKITPSKDCYWVGAVAQIKAFRVQSFGVMGFQGSGCKGLGRMVLKLCRYLDVGCLVGEELGYLNP